VRIIYVLLVSILITLFQVFLLGVLNVGHRSDSCERILLGFHSPPPLRSPPRSFTMLSVHCKNLTSMAIEWYTIFSLVYNSNCFLAPFILCCLSIHDNHSGTKVYMCSLMEFNTYISNFMATILFSTLSVAFTQ
jgi:hypothetical protein